MNLLSSSTSLSASSHPWYATGSMPSFTVIPLYMIILSEMEGITHGEEDLRDDVISKL